MSGGSRRFEELRAFSSNPLRPISTERPYIYSHSVRVSPQLANRLVAAARSVLNRYIPDIYIYTDVYRGEDSGKCVVLS
jgi:RNA 3'-terminal phosphate cyclase